MRFFLVLVMFHSIVANSTPLHCIIGQTVENMSFLERFSYGMHLQKFTKVTDPSSDFAFLLVTKLCKSRIKNLLLDLPKGTHP